jgi:hypothetical protein
VPIIISDKEDFREEIVTRERQRGTQCNDGRFKFTKMM